ncbi:ATP-binding protein [Leptolyngbya ohadii]|uniref:ATP-binding protein n=1 Tax=Leptolyngbya ohadii TaxID=1962290 RepID=UPI000B59A0D1|nr:ATP-binding protein [Leptolyngbya ohadii]
MKMKDALILGLMGASAPLMMVAATLSGRAECQIDRVAKVVRPIGYRSEFQWLFISLGLAQAGMAYSLFCSHQRNGEDDHPVLAAAPTVPRLPHSSAEVAAMSMQAEFEPEPVPMRATIETQAQPIAVPQAQPAKAVTIPPEYLWFKDLIHYPAVLIFGAQGAGKTSFASYLLRCRHKAGHKIGILDPHRAYGQWKGLEVIGEGMDYAAIDEAMKQFEEEVKAAYLDRANNPNFKPSKDTLLAEEMTNWADRCKWSGQFLKTALSDIRKIGKCVLFVSHDRTLLSLGGAKGVSGARDAGMLELELLAKVDPETGEPVPALKGRLKYPGKDPIEVAIAPWMKGGMDFTDLVQAGSAAVQPRTAEPELNRSVNHTQDEECSDSEPSGSAVQKRLEPLGSGLDSDEKLLNRISELKQSGLNQDQIILAVWGAKKGGNKAYLQAREEYKRLTHEG